MEIWDLYDRNRVKLNKTAVRGSKLPKGEYHIVVHVCIFNSNNEMLLQHRQVFKAGWPNKWDVSVGGSAVQGDSSYQAAERETLEEIGLKLDLSSIRPSITINFDNGFDDYYIIETEVDLSKLTLQFEEVQAVKWAKMDEVFKLIDEDMFANFDKSTISLLFNRKRNLIL